MPLLQHPTTEEEMLSAQEEWQTNEEEMSQRNQEMSQVSEDLGNLLASLPIPMVRVQRDRRICYYTSEAEKLFPLSSLDRGRPFQDLQTDLPLSDLEQTLTRVIDTQEPVSLEVQDQAGVWYSVRIRPTITANQVDGAVLTLFDIDFLKRSEQQVRESLDLVHGILETLPESLVLLDANLHVQKVNRSFARTFGQHPEEIVQRPLFEVSTGPWSQAPLRQLLVDALTSNTPVMDFELEYPLPDLGRRSWRIDIRPIAPQGRSDPLLLLTLKDITDQKRAEERRRALERQRFQAQKLESLSVLAGGIAHNLNNLLTPILGYTELARASLPADSSALALLAEVDRSARRAADLVQRILASSSHGKTVVQELNLSELVRDLEGLLKAAVGKQVKLHYDLTWDLPRVQIDALQIRQVILDLVANAREALGDRVGSIGLRTGVIQTDPDTLRSPYRKEDLPPGLYAFLEVWDTGCGMSEETMTRIFDPFYTSKFTGRGLGLVSVLSIAQSHGGTIQVESEPGRGSTFRILLPCLARTSN